MPAGGKTPVMVTRSPGVAAWATVGSGPIKGMYSAHIELTTGQAEYLYVVSGDELYYVDSEASATLIGNVGDPNRIDMDSNITNLVVVNQPFVYRWDGTDFEQLTDPELTDRGAGDVEFLDNFMLFREPESGRFFSAELGSAEDFNALKFATAESNPDNLVGMKAHNGMLHNFGQKVLELWENTGAAGFPFTKIINGEVEMGCLNSRTVAELDNFLYWLADDFTVRRLEGLTPVKVSTYAVDQFLSAATAHTAEAFTYEQDGHFFYVLSFDEGTYAYDVTTGEWAERQNYGLVSWRYRTHAQFAGKELVGDHDSNKIGYLTFDDYRHHADIQRMEWTYQPVYADGIRAFHDRLEIVMETGAGLTTGQGSDPKIMLQFSDDGGSTWKSAPDKSLGARGRRLVRPVWHNLGSSRQRVYRCAISDPVPVTITDTLLEVRGGKL